MKINYFKSLRNKFDEHFKTPGFLRKTITVFISVVLVIAVIYTGGYFITIPRISADYGSTQYESEFGGYNLITNHQMNEDGTLSVNTTGENTWLTNLDTKTAKDDQQAKGINRITMQSVLTIKYVDNDNRTYIGTSYANALDNGSLNPVIENNLNKYKVTYRFLTGKASEGLYITIPIEYEILEGAMTASVVNSEIEENEKFKLLEISLLPYLGAASPEDKGYILIPDGSGALLDYDKITKPIEYNQSIYGRDPSLKIKMKTDYTHDVRLPIFGIKTEDKAMLAIIDEGEALANITVTPKGITSDWSTAYFTFRFREYDTITLNEMGWDERNLPYVSKNSAKAEKFRVKYFFLDGNADYVDMAKLHKEYLIDKYNIKKPNLPSDIPLYLTVNMTVRKIKPVLGLPTHVVEPLTTFNELEEIIDSLKNQGIDKILIDVKGWQKGGRFYKINTNPRFESRIGGYSDFIKLMNKIEEDKSAQLFLSNDFVNGYSSGNGFIPMLQGNRDITGALALQNEYLMSTGVKNLGARSWHLLSPAYSTGIFQRYLNNFRKIANNTGSGISVEGYGDTLYGDVYSSVIGPISGRIISNRQNTLRMWQESLRSIKDDNSNHGSYSHENNFGQVMVSNANQYALPFVDIIMNFPTTASQYKNATTNVPYYQIVASSMVNLASTPVNFSENRDAFYLKCLETGVYPMYSFFARESSVVKNTRLNNLYNGEYSIWRDEVVRNYKKYYDAYKAIRGQEIISHREIDDNIYITTYKNNTKITVNYNDNSFIIED